MATGLRFGVKNVVCGKFSGKLTLMSGAKAPMGGHQGGLLARTNPCLQVANVGGHKYN